MSRLIDRPLVEQLRPALEHCFIAYMGVRPPSADWGKCCLYSQA